MIHFSLRTRTARRVAASAFFGALLLSGCGGPSLVVEPTASQLARVTGASPLKESTLCLVIESATLKVESWATGIQIHPLSQARPESDVGAALVNLLRENFGSVQSVENASQAQGRNCDLTASAEIEWYTKGQRDEYDIYRLKLVFADGQQGPVDTLKVEGKSQDFEDFGYGLNPGDTFPKARERAMRFLAIALRNSAPLADFAARGPQEAEARFQEEAARYLRMSPKPELPEEARRFKIQAETAARDNRFPEAAAMYAKALDVAPWWPGGRFNRALLLGELKSYGSATREMKRYLWLVPDAPDARAARDKIYEWEAKSR